MGKRGGFFLLNVVEKKGSYNYYSGTALLTFGITYFTVWTRDSWNFSSLSPREYKCSTLPQEDKHWQKAAHTYTATSWQKRSIYRIWPVLSASLLVLPRNTRLQYPLSSLESMKSFYEPTFLTGTQNRLLLQSLHATGLPFTLPSLPKNILY